RCLHGGLETVKGEVHECQWNSYFDKVSSEVFEHNPRRNQSRPRLRIQSKYSPLNPPVRRLSRKITSQGEAPADAHQEQNIEFPDVERWSLQQRVQQGEATAGTDDSLDQRSMELSSIYAPHSQSSKIGQCQSQNRKHQ